MSCEIEIHSCASEKSIMSFPLGALCIKTAVNTSGNLPRCAVIEHYLAEDPVKEAEKTACSGVKYVGLSMYIWNSRWFETYASHLKELVPSIVIFAGGPQVSAFKDNVPSYLTFAVHGEGEEAVVSALSDIVSGKIVDKLITAKPVDLSKLSSPFLTGNCDSALENCDGALWEMTRGCPFCCAFCYESRGNRNVRDYDFERIQKELFYLIEKEVCNVFVLDPTFNLNKERAKSILNFLLENAPDWMHFTFEIRAELLDEELADMFATLNCSLQIGLQSSNPEVLKGINRTFDKAEFEKKVRLLQKRGASYGLDIIIGLPGDTFESFRSTVNFAVSLQPSNIDCFVLSLLPGTELSLKAQELGLVCGTDVERTLVSSPTFSAADIESAKALSDTLGLFYTKGQACMWIHCILETLNITTCNLLSLFAKWMKQTNRSEDEDIWLLQDQFVTSLFEKTQNGKLIPAITSFMGLHQAFCYVTDNQEPIQLELNYSPDDLALLDKTSLSEFVKTHKQKYCTPIIDLDDDISLIIR